MEMQLEIEKAKELLATSMRILLVSHRRPDGDTLGASVALACGLQQLGKQTTPACIDEISPRLEFLSSLLPHPLKFVREFVLEDFDLIIISDAGASHMTGFEKKYPDFLSRKVPIINIDHHASNEHFGTVNLVDKKASSATMIVWKFLKELHITPTQAIARSLLAGIYNDTGGFMHANTTQETFEVAAELACLERDVTTVVKPLFKHTTYPQLKLWGHILENMRRNEKNVVSSVVTESDLKILGASSGDTGGIVDLMNTVPDAQFTLLLAEDDGVVKGSLRTQRSDVNLSDLAGRFGGGGHTKASGFRMQGRLEKEIVWKIIPSNGESVRIAVIR